MFRSAYGTRRNRSKFDLVFWLFTDLFAAGEPRTRTPVQPPGKVRTNATFSPRNENDNYFNHWLPWLEIERGKIEIQSVGWESCRGEGGTCGSVI